MKRFVLFLSFAILIMSCSENKVSVPDADELVRAWSKKVINEQIFYVERQYSEKILLSADTFRTNVASWIVRDELDTLWRAKIYTLYLRDSSEAFYFDAQGYVRSGRDSIIYKYPEKYAEYAVAGYGSRIVTYIVEPNKIYDLISDTLNEISVYDTNVHSTNVFAIKIALPDNGDYSKQKLILFFKRQDTSLMGFYREVYVISDWQKELVWITKFETNSFTPTFVEDRFNELTASYTVEDLPLGGDDDQFNLLNSGTKAPNFNGIIYGTQDTFNLYSQHAKVYVLDFWYQSCRPCMKAIPYLVDLYNNYKDQGLLVVGINSVDNNDKRRPYIAKFIEYKQITYPIVLVERLVDISYKVPGYPTLYVLDANFNVIDSEVGFNPDEKLDRIEQTVKEALQN